MAGKFSSLNGVRCRVMVIAAAMDVNFGDLCVIVLQMGGLALTLGSEYVIQTSVSNG